MLKARAVIIRTGKQMKLVLDGAGADESLYRDPALIKLIAKAQQAQLLVTASDACTLDEAAAEQGLTRSYLARLLRLSYLAPDIVTTILDGRQPPALTRQRLARLPDLPLAWDAQRELLGTASA